MTFTWNNVESSTYSIIVTRLPQPQIPERRATRYTVPGRAGDLTVLEPGHEPVKKTVECLVTDLTNIDDIFAWLQGSGIVVFSDRSDKAFRARITSAIPVQYDGPALRAFSVEFLCQPYAYQATPDDDIEITTSPDELENIGTVESEPVIVIEGSGDITLTIGNQTITLAGVSGSITVDCEQKLTYSGETVLNSSQTGDYPTIPVGDVDVSFTGTVTKITITPNWRWIG